MKKLVILIIVLVILAVVVFFIVKKKADKKIELATFGGMTKDEFRQNLNLAWKGRYFDKTTEALMLPESWATTWRKQIDDAIAVSQKPLSDAVLETVQFAWAKDNPKANANPWSKGWLREIHVKQNLGINPIPDEVLKIVNEI